MKIEDSHPSPKPCGAPKGHRVRRPSERSRPGGRGNASEGSRRGEAGDRRRSRRPRPGDDREKTAPPVAPATPTPSFSEAPAKLLASVSRSFSITINLLPPPLREPISCGYLLARALDSIADANKPAAAQRLTHLRALLEMIKYGVDPELMRPLQKEVAAGQTHEGERTLIGQLPACLALLEACQPADRWELQRTLARIGRGQELDVQRFGEGGAAPAPLKTAAELDEYTYFVAGCVGELWTRLCRSHLPADWSKRDEAAMLALGKRFGQGLQMVNILRDLPADLAAGRCYLPLELLAKHGLEVDSLKSSPAKARLMLDELRAVALGHLDAAWEYVSALTSRKLRHACALPVLIGLETLALLAKNPALETAERVKMPRSALRRLMASAALGAILPGWLDGLHGRLRRRAGA